MKLCRRSLPWIALLFTLSFQTGAQVPQVINYQGRLIGTNGLVNGNVGLSLRLYNVPGGGSSIYEDSNSVPVADGLYSTFIGDNPTNSSFLTALTNAAVYLEVAVNGTALAPRERLASVAYALTADAVKSQGLFWHLSGNTGVVPGTHFLGTLNSNTVEIRVDNQAVMRFVPNLYPSIIGGAATNRIASDVFGSTISGGGAVDYPNQILTSSQHGVIGGGRGNTIANNAQENTIGGGYQNQIGLQSDNAVVGGGIQNSIGNDGDHSTIGGGFNNLIPGTAGTLPSDSVIGGGRDNFINSKESTIAGGNANRIGTNSVDGAIGGGYSNVISDLSSYSTIGGGMENRIFAFPADFGTISGGRSNSVSGKYATVPGGHFNTASGQLSFAAGFRAKANHNGAFVWGDTNVFDIASTNSASWTVRAVGGVRFITAISNNGTVASAAVLPPGSGAWAAMSDRNVKDNFKSIDAQDILDRVIRMPITTWNMKTQDPSIRHIGPMAQDFHAAFAVGEDERYIPSSDADGVALAAIQGLYQVVQEQRAEIDRLREELNVLKQEGKREPWSPSAPPEAGKLAPPDVR